MNRCTDNIKISIVGCGNVGATIAYATVLQGLVTEITLCDINVDKAHGLLLDLEHSLSFTENCALTCTDKFSDVAGSSVVIITAGARQNDGESRLDLTNKNKLIFDKMIGEIVAAAPEALLLIVSNPLDVMTYYAWSISNLPKNQVFGTGTILDTARYRFHLSEKLKVSPKSINAYILGEHGDSSFPALSCADIGGVKLSEFPGFDKQIADECLTLTKTAAYRIIHDQGFTCYSIATATIQLLRAILDDSNEIFPVSTVLENYNGISNVALSVPCVIGRNGIEKVIPLNLTSEETDALQASAKIIKEYL